MDLSNLVHAYTDALRRNDESQARTIIHRARREGLDPDQIYLGIFAPSMVQIGRLWEENLLSVAQEHLATAITERLIGELSPLFTQPTPSGRRIILGCVQGEMHTLGIRMLADLFVRSGWRVLYLGANVPTPEWGAIAERTLADAVGISVNSRRYIPEAAQAIANIRACCPEVQIAVGGAAFTHDPQLWQQTGADLYAQDAAAVIATMSERIPINP